MTIAFPFLFSLHQLLHPLGDDTGCPVGDPVTEALTGIRPVWRVWLD